jgi:hypothetical protein
VRRQNSSESNWLLSRTVRWRKNEGARLDARPGGSHRPKNASCTPGDLARAARSMRWRSVTPSLFLVHPSEWPITPSLPYINKKDPLVSSLSKLNNGTSGVPDVTAWRSCC